jgi:hypothetical protein
MKRLQQLVLIASAIIASWLGMQLVHEGGHIVGALLIGGKVQQVVLDPLTISRTDLSVNPNPLLVVWAGPAGGVLFPLAVWGIAAAWKLAGAFVLRFFAGFCLIANGAYIAFGSFDGVGDCCVMLRHGSRMWQLWLFGAVTIPLGLRLWHGLGPSFGLGQGHWGSQRSRSAYNPLRVFAADRAGVLGRWRMNE